MRHVLPVNIIESQQNLLGDHGSMVLRKIVNFFNFTHQITLSQKLHDHKEFLLCFQDFEDSDNMGMVCFLQDKEFVSHKLHVDRILG